MTEALGKKWQVCPVGGRRERQGREWMTEGTGPRTSQDNGMTARTPVPQAPGRQVEQDPGMGLPGEDEHKARREWSGSEGGSRGGVGGGAGAASSRPWARGEGRSRDQHGMVSREVRITQVGGQVS